MKNEPTISDVLKAVNTLSQQTDERFTDVLEAVNTLSTNIDERFDGVDKRFEGIDKRLSHLEKDMTQVKATMVTKNYLDDKLYDLRGDLVVLMRKEDRKMVSLIEVLRTRKVISDEDAKSILAMELFPQIAR